MNQQFIPSLEEIRLNSAKDSLAMHYQDGCIHHLPAEYLRVESPSAEVQGHGAGQAITVAGKRHVTIRAIEPVGNYAIKLVFSDGHDTGLFTWAYLHQLGIEQDVRWQGYLEKLKVKNLSRDASTSK